MRAFLVANPNAGGVRRAAFVEGIERHLRARGLSVTRITSGSAAEARAHLREKLLASSRAPVLVAAGGFASFDPRPVDPAAESAGARVIVVGGDGTVNALLPVLEETGAPLAIIPAGTFNALAGELGLPRDPRGALEIAVNGSARPIDLAFANGRPFSQMLGVGFDAAVVHSVLPTANKRMLSPAALARGMRLLAGYRPVRARITADDAVVEAEAWLILVANASRYTYCVEGAPGARVDDGWLDVWIFQPRSRTEAARQALSIVRSRVLGLPGTTHLRARRLRIETESPSWVHVDGDPGGRTPLDIAIAPGALNVIAPASASLARVGLPAARA